MERPRIKVAVVMQRRETANRWQTHVWAPIGVLTGTPAAVPRRLVDERGEEQWLHSGLEIVLRTTDADGYYLNVSTQEPKVFVLWRMEGENAVPHHLTVSYSEASSWMDGGEQVDSVPMPPELFAWVGEFVEKYYRPEPKRRIRPQSFRPPGERAPR
ncbi:MAG: hypothetical protein A3I63_10115 [Betaproteobacteria bacterium RIFCSPLOWO2_02_FULL_66_14]|nr:MAG: hypothetical protein A3I63_10115 [Betaproteobacteria bacterium RIFCSPLOWO2_02_FULL_66_14]